MTAVRPSQNSSVATEAGETSSQTVCLERFDDTFLDTKAGVFNATEGAVLDADAANFVDAHGISPSPCWLVDFLFGLSLDGHYYMELA